MDIFAKRKKSVDNIYLHYLGNEFKKVFGETKKNGCGWFQPLKKPYKDPIKTAIECFIPEKKYGKVIMNKSLGELGYIHKLNSKKVGMKPDYFIEKLGLIFEFDGPIHYQNTFKILKDQIKYTNLNSIELNGKPKILRVIRIPYYWQLTRDVAKYIFDDLMKHFSESLPNLPKEGFYSDEKYFKALSKIYQNMFTGKRATSELEIPACGIHDSTEGPARFSWQGIDKLLSDFENKDDLLKPPKSIEHQYMWCLKYWLIDIEKAGNKNMEWLILPLKKDHSPWHERFMDRYNENINNKKEEYLQHIFARDYHSIIRTKKI
tara:strand:- start:435 stop:1391 length:957 start_codon:yes stop_codon:yes gene_type:complete